MDLLYLLAYWQALAKLRLHTEHTLNIFKNVTRLLGITLRAFQKHVNSTFQTKELRREATSRVRKAVKASQRTKQKAQNVVKKPVTMTKDNSKQYAIASVIVFMNPLKIAPDPSEVHSESPYTRRRKVLNLNTYKLHSLGDYPDTIRQYGTTDSYSTQIVSNIFPLEMKLNLSFSGRVFTP